MTKGATVIIANAIIWGAVLVGSALALRGTGMFSEIQLILVGGAVISNLVVGGIIVSSRQEAGKEMQNEK